MPPSGGIVLGGVCHEMWGDEIDGGCKGEW